MKKTCTKCFSAKDISLFHKDSSAKDGYSSACGACRNNRKKAPRIVHKVKIEEITTDNVKNDPEPSAVQGNIFKMLSERFGGSFYTIAVEGTGVCRVQVFRGQPKVIKGEGFNVEELMMKLAR